MQQVIIKIKSRITDMYGVVEETEFTADGKYAEKNGKYYIIYDESEISGFKGSTTTLTVEHPKKIVLTRKGQNATQLFMEKGERNICHYSTGYGGLTVGIFTTLINSELDENGGTLRFCYNIDIDSDKFSNNEIDITVRRA